MAQDSPTWLEGPESSWIGEKLLHLTNRTFFQLYLNLHYLIAHTRRKLSRNMANWARNVLVWSKSSPGRPKNKDCYLAARIARDVFVLMHHKHRAGSWKKMDKIARSQWGVFGCHGEVFCRITMVMNGFLRDEGRVGFKMKNGRTLSVHRKSNTDIKALVL